MIERENPGQVPYTTFTNELLNDPDLTAEALGVLVYLLSKPANWRVMPAELAKRFGCGRDRVYKILANLLEAGYARRGQARDQTGSFASYNYIISANRSPLPENTEAADLPHTDSPLPEKTTLQKKESTKERYSEMDDDYFCSSKLAPTSPAKPKRKVRATIDPDLVMSEKNKKYATDRGFSATYAATVFDNFKNYHLAKGSLMLDWDAAWRTWVGNETRFTRHGGPPGRPSRPGGGVYGDDYM